MTLEQRLPRFAVLIDADNTSPQIADGLFEEIAKFGEASVRRIYGDFSTPQLKSWAEILQKHAIDPYQQFAYTKGKNASDIALVIDAMDLLHSGRFDGFCLVSSDSDFTRLASRLREQGADVYGFGAQKTPGELPAGLPPLHLHREPAARGAGRRAGARGAAERVKPLQPPSAAIPLLKKAIAQIDSEGRLGQPRPIGQQLTNLVSDFDARTYGFKKLSDLVRNTGAFQVEKQAGGGIRVRPAPPDQPGKAKKK